MHVIPRQARPPPLFKVCSAVDGGPGSPILGHVPQAVRLLGHKYIVLLSRMYKHVRGGHRTQAPL